MRKQFWKMAALVALAGVMAASCGGSKQLAATPAAPPSPTVSPTDNRAAQNQPGEVNLPFTGKEYKSDANAFRGKGVGRSPDMATAKKVAMTNVKTEIAGAIRTTVKDVTDQYTKQRTVADQQELGISFDQMTRTVVNEILTNIDVMDEKVYRETDGKYAYWVVIEVAKNQVLNGLNDKISKDAKLQLDFDKFQFQKTFDAEMSKFENQ
jgi:hypothetical protein